MNVEGIEVTEHSDPDGYRWEWEEDEHGKTVQRVVKWVPNSRYAACEFRMPPGGWSVQDLDVGEETTTAAGVREIVRGMVRT